MYQSYHSGTPTAAFAGPRHHLVPQVNACRVARAASSARDEVPSLVCPLGDVPGAGDQEAERMRRLATFTVLAGVLMAHTAALARNPSPTPPGGPQPTWIQLSHRSYGGDISVTLPGPEYPLFCLAYSGCPGWAPRLTGDPATVGRPALVARLVTTAERVVPGA